MARALLTKRQGNRLWNRVFGRYDATSLICRETRAEARARKASGRPPRLHHLDVHLTDHCNLNCRSCEHYSSISKPVFTDLSTFEADLTRLAGLFEGIDQVYLLGGEPLLHPQVEEFVRVARKHLPGTRICLMTNGVLVPKMGDSFWGALHETETILLCDQYPGVADVEAITALGAEHGVVVEFVQATEQFFRAPIDLSGTCDPQESFVRCTGVSNCATIKDGRMYPCAHIAYADILRERFDIEQLHPGPEDSISVHGDATGDDIVDFLMSPVPWCANCDYPALEYFEWGRTSRSIDEWVRVDGSGVGCAARGERGRS
jgi:MoaA/NifB/PqqE/SkfB family radical SAM enzyme